MREPAVEARGLGRRFGQRWALAHLDLTIREGERFLVLGSNGSGKTTLLRLLATAISPSCGSLEILGHSSAQRPAIRPEVALLSHRLGLYEDLSGEQNLDLLASLSGRPAESARWLQEVGLDRRPDPVRTYSAGMRKRLGLARLLAQRPRLALIDEPYGQLDPEGFRLSEAIFARLHEEGVTLVIASHLVQRASERSDRALLLQAGLPRWQGAAAQAERAWTTLHRGEVIS